MLRYAALNALDIFALTKCYAVQIGNNLAKFRYNPWVPSSRGQADLDYLNTEYGTDRLSRSVAQ